MLITVPEAARRVRRDPETVRRWIRAGKLRSQKVGTQHLVDEDELLELTAAPDTLPMPEAWRPKPGEPPEPDWVAIIRRSRDSH